MFVCVCVCVCDREKENGNLVGERDSDCNNATNVNKSR